MWHLSSSARDAHFGISSQQLEETHRPPGAPDDAFGNHWCVLLRSLPPGDTCAQPGHLQCPAGPPSHSLGTDTALRIHIRSPLATAAKEVDRMKARRHTTEQEREALPISGCVCPCRAESCLEDIQMCLSLEFTSIQSQGGG